LRTEKYVEGDRGRIIGWTNRRQRNLEVTHVPKEDWLILLPRRWKQFSPMKR
jgi:hypothetical protein